MLLAAGGRALEAQATPVLPEERAWSREAPDESYLSDEAAETDAGPLPPARWWSLAPGPAFGDAPAAPRNGQWGDPGDFVYAADGYADLPAQFDDAFNQSTLLRQLMRRRDAAAASELGLGGVIDDVLRSAWDSVSEDGNTASYSLAGIELSLTLRSDQRSLMVNGYDVLPTLLSGVQGQVEWQNATVSAPRDIVRASHPAPALAAASGGDTAGLVADLVVTYERARDFVLHPLTIFVGITYLFTWLGVRVAQALRERRRTYRRYRYR
jgi:hypothetical protein